MNCTFLAQTAHLIWASADCTSDLGKCISYFLRMWLTLWVHKIQDGSDVEYFKAVLRMIGFDNLKVFIKVE